jgi:hypothetical protein
MLRCSGSGTLILSVSARSTNLTCCRDTLGGYGNLVDFSEKLIQGTHIRRTEIHDFGGDGSVIDLTSGNLLLQTRCVGASLIAAARYQYTPAAID